MSASDAAIQQTDQLTVALRALLRQWDRVPSPIVASALAYETAAIIAKDAASEADAIALLAVWHAVMVHQIRTWGVGVEHP